MIRLGLTAIRLVLHYDFAGDIFAVKSRKEGKSDGEDGEGKQKAVFKVNVVLLYFTREEQTRGSANSAVRLIALTFAKRQCIFGAKYHHIEICYVMCTRKGRNVLARLRWCINETDGISLLSGTEQLFMTVTGKNREKINGPERPEQKSIVLMEDLANRFSSLVHR